MVARSGKSTWGRQRTALEIFDGLASSYERVLNIATLGQDRYWKRWAIARAGTKRGQRVLDVGCGTCLLEELVEGQGYNVVGLDLTERMVRVGQSKRISSVEALMVGDAESLPFSGSAFDVVVSCYVPKYVDLTKFAEEVARVLRPGGTVVLYDFVRPSGFLSPFLRLYIHGGLRLTGFLLELVGSETATTFSNLPRIVEGARWNESITNAFWVENVRTLNCTTLSRGVVGAYFGVKVNGS